MEPILRADNLHLSFHGIQAVAGVGFDIIPREIFGGDSGRGEPSLSTGVSG